jgi:HEAT repeat protein
MEITEAITLLRHVDADIRNRAMEALRQWGQAAVPALLSALDHPEPMVRGNVALLLGQIGAQEAVAPLAARVAVLSPGDDRTFCVRSLADLSGPHLRGEPGLLDLFSRLSQENDLFVRALACTALGRLGDPRAVPILVRAQGDAEPWVREAAQKALEDLARAPQPGKEKRPAATAALAAPPPGAAAPMAPSELTPPGGTEPPGVACAHPAPSSENLSAGPLDPARLERLVDDLYSRDPTSRDLAAEELVLAGSAAVPLLCRAIRSPVQDPPLLALTVLGRIGDRAALGPLLGVVAVRGTSTELRTVAIRAIAQLCQGNESSVLDFLLKERSSDALLSAAVATALGAFRSVRAVRALLTYLDDENEFVRESAAAALTRAACPGVPDLVTRLVATARDDPDERVRAKATEALSAALSSGACPPEVAVRAAVALLEDPRSETRLAGLKLLRATRRRHLGAAEALVRALGDSDRSVRLEACELLGEVAPLAYAPAVEALRHLATDPDREVSRAAIGSLGLVGGPEARLALRLLRGDSDPDLADAARAALGRMHPEEAEIIPLRPER